MNFLTRLGRDVAGNTIAIVAAAMIPLVAMIGSGVDMSRAYMVESRLQQACDAGVLAGRKQMEATGWNSTASNAATDYFEVNYQEDYLGSQNLTFTPTNPSGTTVVQGVASVDVPTAIMHFFAIDEFDVSVSCEADVNMGNTDVTFVLDTTGSMVCPSDADPSACSGYIGTHGIVEGRSYGSYSTTSRLSALESAVENFYTTLDTAVGSASTRVRYGFVPYTGTVNVGYLLNPSWIADSHNYQSVERVTTTTTTPAGWEVHYTSSSIPQGSCGYYSGTWHGTRIYGSWVSGQCVFRDWHSASTSTSTTTELKQRTLNVSSYKTGASVADPTGIRGGSFTWDGCIEERQTTPATSFSYNSSADSITPAAALDLDIDSAPTASDSTKWKPYWPEVVAYRAMNTTTASGGSWSQTSCPHSAALLATYANVTAVSNYLDNLVADGGTYHDIGLLWGARISSPTGIFSTNVNATPSNGNAVDRHIIFMTDGTLDPGDSYYHAYGVERHDGRITGMQTSTSSSDVIDQQKANINSRIAALCSAIKGKGIRLWVVAFNTALTSQLTSCASPNSSFTADNSAELNSRFQSIAENIADLRLTD